MTAQEEPIIFNVDDSKKGRLLFSLHGRSEPRDVESMLEAVRSRVKKLRHENCEVVFDLTEVDPVYNTAGRWLDIARQYSNIDRGQKFRLKLLKSLYDDLLITDDELPKRSAGTITLGKLRIQVVARSDSNQKPLTLQVGQIASPSRSISQNEFTLHEWPGKVRTINNDIVTVSLFTGQELEDEVVGELALAQFPSAEIKVGQIFCYNVFSVIPGETLVRIKMIESKPINDNTMIDLYLKSKSMFPEDV